MFLPSSFVFLAVKMKGLAKSDRVGEVEGKGGLFQLPIINKTLLSLSVFHTLGWLFIFIFILNSGKWPSDFVSKGRI